MSGFVTFISCLSLSYMCGSIPVGKIIGLRRGIDIQKKGSGNIGFANAVRVLGWKSGVVVLIFDIAKGFTPTYIAIQHLSYNQALFVGLTAVVGHVYTVFLKFKGGKGVATGLGVSLALAPLVAISGLVAYILVFLLFKKSAIGSLVGAWSLPLISLLLKPEYFLFGLIMAIFGTYTHRNNIRQMLDAR